MKKRVNISLDEETAERIKKLARDSHKNVSQWITDVVWSVTKEEKTGKAGKK